MSTPIFIPISSSTHQPSKCPNCDKVEDIKEVCNHCDYVYQCDEPWTTGECFAVWTVVSLVIWFVWTVIWWMCDQQTGTEFSNWRIEHGQRTLLEVLTLQWNWIVRMFNSFIGLFGKLW